MAKQSVTNTNGRTIIGILSIDDETNDSVGVEIDGERYILSALLDKYDAYDIKIEVSNKRELSQHELECAKPTNGEDSVNE